MRRLLFPLLLALCLALPSVSQSQSRPAVVRTVDGSLYEGKVSSREETIEWRKDIYELRGEDGRSELFILTPEYKGRIDLVRIREIRRISRDQAPRQAVTLSNGQQAVLIQKYLIVLVNGNNFYISDFITLDNFYLDVDTGRLTRRLYLSQIDRLTYLTAAPATVTKVSPSPPPRMTQPRVPATVVRPQALQPPAALSPAPRSTAVSPAVIALSIVSGLLLILLLVFAILLRKRSKKGSPSSLRRRPAAGKRLKRRKS